MKVLFSIPYFAPAYSYGGPVAVSEQIAKGLIDYNVEVDVLTTDVFDAKNRNPVLFEKINGINVNRLQNRSNFLAKNANLYAPKKVKIWLKNNIMHYDLVHFHDVFAFFLTMPVMDACIEKKLPFIVQPHGTTNNEHIENSGILKPVKKYLLNQYQKRFNSANAFVALSQVERHAISRYYDSGMIQIIPNGIDIPVINEIETYNIRKELGIDNASTKIILFLGRLHSIKGLDISLKTLAAIKNKVDFHFVIVGPDEQNEKSKLESLAENLSISDRITFYGPVYGDEKFKLLRSSDLFMLLSRAEGHPMTCIEALACGTPIFVSKAAGLPEFKQYQVGKIVDAYNLTETQNSLLEILSTDSVLQNMRKNTKKIVEELFSREQMVEKFYQLYSRILQ